MLLHHHNIVGCWHPTQIQTFVSNTGWCLFLGFWVEFSPWSWAVLCSSTYRVQQSVKIVVAIEGPSSQRLYVIQPNTVSSSLIRIPENNGDCQHWARQCRRPILPLQNAEVASEGSDGLKLLNTL